MLTFKFLTFNDVDLWRKMLTFKLLILNDVDLVDLYMRYHVDLVTRK